MRYLTEIFTDGYESIDEKEYFLCHKDFSILNGKKKVNILALGDVGGTLLTGLKLLGGESIDEIGIYDLNEKNSKRYEIEMNQIAYPFTGGERQLPNVKVIEKEKLFQCDCFVFCASMGVPKVGEEKEDVRMVQYKKNKELIETYAKEALKENFQGVFAVVSDPVDPLCKASVKAGLRKEQVRGFGLGVMNARAMYYAKGDKRFEQYLTRGRAYGPHGEDLVIADDIREYDHQISEELTSLTVKANLETRALGYKPYIAPSISSGAISIILMLNGEWHYSSIYFGSAFLGVKNRLTTSGTHIENPPLCDKLFHRIERALKSLEILE